MLRWWGMYWRQMCHLWAVPTHVHFASGMDPAASPMGEQRDTENWSIASFCGWSNSRVVAGVLEAQFFFWRLLRGRASNGERNVLYLVGIGKEVYMGRWQLPGCQHILLTSVSVCVVLSFLLAFQITAYGDIRGWWGEAYVAWSCASKVSLMISSGPQFFFIWWQQFVDHTGIRNCSGEESAYLLVVRVTK